MTTTTDFTKLRVAAGSKVRYIDNCIVLDVGSGAFPREIEVRIPGDDGAVLRALNNVFPGLTTSDTVLISTDNSNQVARVEGFGTDTPTSTSTLQDALSFIVLNSSGGVATANDVGYIDENGDYQTTTTEGLNDVNWCVVVQGGANSTDIYVTRQGRVTVAYAGSAPSDGDFLITSTTAGSALASATMRPEIFARCLAAGSGGTVTAMMYAGRANVSATVTTNLLRVRNNSGSDFVAVIAAAGVSGTKVYHDPPTSGTVDAVDPVGLTEVGKLVLHNTTQAEEAFIDDTGTDATDDFLNVTNSAHISGWVTSDNIEVRSQTNTGTSGGFYFFEVDISESSLPLLLTGLTFALHVHNDTGAPPQDFFVHPYEADVTSKRQRSQTLVAGLSGAGVNLTVPLINQRFVVLYKASGSATCEVQLRYRGGVLATT